MTATVKPMRELLRRMSGNMAEELYFAYGSNLNAERMKERKAFFIKREAAKLPGYRFEFSKRTSLPGAGVGNIVASPQSTVHGILYSLEKGGLDKLDVFEQTREGHYQREIVKVETDDGNFAEATAYVARASVTVSGLKPERWYLNHLLAGKELLPPHYYAFLKNFETFD